MREMLIVNVREKHKCLKKIVYVVSSRLYRDCEDIQSSD